MVKLPLVLIRSIPLIRGATFFSHHFAINHIAALWLPLVAAHGFVLRILDVVFPYNVQSLPDEFACRAVLHILRVEQV